MSRRSRTSVEEGDGNSNSPANVSDIEKTASGEKPVEENIENVAATGTIDQEARPEAKVCTIPMLQPYTYRM